MNALEKKKTKYANSNIDVDDHGTNNRINYLVPTSCHDSHMVKFLSEKLKKPNQFCPGKFLKQKVFDRVTSVQVLIMGNTSQEQANNFCEGTIAKVFKTTVEEGDGGFDVRKIPN